MNEALCSIISGEDEWCFDTEGRSIKFNKDGTGELWCRCNFNYWIAAELEWKNIESLEPVKRVKQIDQNVEIGSTTQKNSPYLLGQLNLEITLAKKLPQRAQSSHLSKSTIINELGLTDEAFRPKTYTIRLEKGNFLEPSYVGFQSSGRPRFALRLLFDKSPYPPRSEWRKPEGGPDQGQFWDHKEFVSRSSSELEKQGRAMNDPPPTGWSNCTVS